MVPADPDPEQQQQQQKERNVTAHQDSGEAAAAGTKTKIDKLLRKLQPLHARIARQLWHAGPRRRVVVAGATGRRCLAFIETELSIKATQLTILSLRHLDGAKTKEWLEDSLFPVLREVDPSRHTLLRRASEWFRQLNRRKSYLFWLLYETLQLYYINEHPSRYMHLLLTSSNLGLTTQLAVEAGVLLPVVGVERPAKKIFRWLTHEGDDYTSLRVMSIVGPVGIGKTTLAVEVRNRLIRHETSSGGQRHYFHCNVMARAARRADRNILLLQDILSQLSDPAGSALSSDQSQCNTMELLLPLVSERLQYKRYYCWILDILCPFV